MSLLFKDKQKTL